MAMSLSAAGNGDPMIEMNTTPLIDVMLVLLIMFIVTLPVMTNSINLELPQQPGIVTKREVISLAIDFDGTIIWNGVAVDLDQLERYFRIAAARTEQPELHVRPDRRTEYDRVAQVLGIAQRNGIQRIGFAGQEQYDN